MKICAYNIAVEDALRGVLSIVSMAQKNFPERSIAANVRWAIRKGFEEGIPNGHKPPYGYEWDGEKNEKSLR